MEHKDQRNFVFLCILSRLFDFWIGLEGSEGVCKRAFRATPATRRNTLKNLKFPRQPPNFTVARNRVEECIAHGLILDPTCPIF